MNYVITTLQALLALLACGMFLIIVSALIRDIFKHKDDGRN